MRKISSHHLWIAKLKILSAPHCNHVVLARRQIACGERRARSEELRSSRVVRREKEHAGKSWLGVLRDFHSELSAVIAQDDLDGRQRPARRNSQIVMQKILAAAAKRGDVPR